MLGENKHKRILSGRDAESFVGRTEELGRILADARGEGSAGILLRYAPRTGATELLRQAYDRLFADDGSAPVYFSMRSGETAAEAARRFAYEFLTQTVAHRRSDSSILFSALTLPELIDLVNPADLEFFESQAKWLAEAPYDQELFVQRCLTLPLAASAVGIRSYVLFDDLHLADVMPNGHLVTNAFREIARGGRFPFCMAAYRRSRAFTGEAAETLHLASLSKEETLSVIETFAASRHVRISESVRDLMYLVTKGDLVFIRGLTDEAAAAAMPLESYHDLGNVFSASVFGGTIAEIYDRIFRLACGGPAIEKGVIRLLLDSMDGAGSPLSFDIWQKKLGLAASEADALLGRLNVEEIVRSGSRRVDVIERDSCLADYLTVRNSLEAEGKRRAAVFGSFLSDFLVNAPKVMEREYRRASAIGLKDLLSQFENRSVPAALFDYEAYRIQYKGLAPREAEQNLRADEDLLTLPRIVFSAHTDAFYNAIGLITESERSAVAVGFETGAAGSEEPVAWIAAEIESKLEANAELAEFWCDRLEMAAEMCGFERFKLWLVAPEGFDEAAMSILRERSCLSSSRRQVEFLRKRLVQTETPDTSLEEYEIVIPMGEDSEMVAAHALEDIAKRHDFGTKEINQIKTALVEACINAAEHSHSLDRRIHQKFVVGPDYITITVSNRGIRLIDNRNPEPPSNEGRRGWGLKLMRQLMDEVRIEQVDDGTRISMTKYLSRKKAA
ncbi:MAG: ATP-binding protein [Acidobacteria bacterium]|nr:ATP-binding protein [Acidobacteriota bacterium]